MRTLCLTTALLLASLASAAPALGDKPTNYEYAELRYSRQNQGVAFMPGAPGGGGVGVVVIGGAPGGPGIAAPAMPAPNMKVVIRWTTAEEEIEGTEWEDLAKKLKAPDPKKEGSSTIHKMRVLNRLSAEGWEMVPTPVMETGATGVWQFRRKLPY